ncbi:DUF6578 domain-containing protein [Streptomyces sp. 900105755]|uniref:DUF6578 domain-containing protein n=1 Tax=unclassified Streptomyces TaxID=2593676 RepID=UPI000897C9CB|nr:DUF6578 domain-containing protein [Streptomyces sp. Ag109_O5-10]SEF08892.1 hypothetical protein SAMN05216533_6130 [Streptomyces sp. Ag109_O5-10]
MPLLKVFYEDWQMECCGTPFSVGDEVAWKLVAYGAGAGRGNAGYGAEAWVENHGGPDRPTTGRVHAVDLVHEEYRFRRADPAPPREGKGKGQGNRAGVVLQGTGRGLEAVPGTVTLEPADSCPRWFGEVDLGTMGGLGRVRRTCGALVTLDAPDTGHVLHP